MIKRTKRLSNSERLAREAQWAIPNDGVLAHKRAVAEETSGQEVRRWQIGTGIAVAGIVVSIILAISF